MDNGGVAGDHHNAGKDEGDNDLVPGEVDAEQTEDKVSSRGNVSYVLGNPSK